MPHLICPNCAGQKEFLTHLNKGDKPHEWKLVACGMCNGTAYVTREQVNRYEAARARRAERMSRDMSLREEAARLGISAVELSALERGY